MENNGERLDSYYIDQLDRIFEQTVEQVESEPNEMIELRQICLR